MHTQLDHDERRRKRAADKRGQNDKARKALEGNLHQDRQGKTNDQGFCGRVEPLAQISARAHDGTCGWGPGLAHLHGKGIKGTSNHKDARHHVDTELTLTIASAENWSHLTEVLRNPKANIHSDALEDFRDLRYKYDRG